MVFLIKFVAFFFTSMLCKLDNLFRLYLWCCRPLMKYEYGGSKLVLWPVMAWTNNWLSLFNMQATRWLNQHLLHNQWSHDCIAYPVIWPPLYGWLLPSKCHTWHYNLPQAANGTQKGSYALSFFWLMLRVGALSSFWPSPPEYRCLPVIFL